jgi:hypothetical protein
MPKSIINAGLLAGWVQQNETMSVRLIESTLSECMLGQLSENTDICEKPKNDQMVEREKLFSNLQVVIFSIDLKL